MTESPVLTLTLSPKTPIEKGEYAAKEVSLCEADISVIPAQLFTTFRNVTKLDLRGNELEVLPDAIGECVALRKLFLSRNRLRTIPESIGKCICIEDLILSNNEIQLIPESIGELRSMVELDLRMNQLDTIPDTIINCISLQSVFATLNHFTGAQDSLRRLQALFNVKIYMYPNRNTHAAKRIIQGVNYTEESKF